MISDRKFSTAAKYVYTHSGLIKMLWNSTHHFVIDINEHQVWMNSFTPSGFENSHRHYKVSVSPSSVIYSTEIGMENFPSKGKKQWPLKRSKTDTTSSITRKTFEEIDKDCPHAGNYRHKFLFIKEVHKTVIIETSSDKSLIRTTSDV